MNRFPIGARVINRRFEIGTVSGNAFGLPEGHTATPVIYDGEDTVWNTPTDNLRLADGILIDRTNGENMIRDVTEELAALLAIMAFITVLLIVCGAI